MAHFNKKIGFSMFLPVTIVFFLLGNILSLKAQSGETVTFAVIGDYGSEGQALQDVANLILSWNPDLIITLGDNNYPDGDSTTIDPNIGQYFHSFISPYYGNFGTGADTNRFFPTLGNHDWRTTNAQPYLDYFTLPGNERYYDFVWGPVHFFALDSDGHEPDGNDQNSVQAGWLQTQLSQSQSPWNVVYFHHPPYSSGAHGSITHMQWPFKDWGASVVMAGHDHTYERLLVDSLTYFVNGIGGRSIYSFQDSLPQTQVRYNGDYGAMLVVATQDSINFKFINRSGVVIDSHTLYQTPTLIDNRERNPISGTFVLEQNYPNPFNPSTEIRFEVPEKSPVSLRVFDITGRMVTTLVNEVLPGGSYRITYDAGQLPAGVYFYQLSSSGIRLTRKMVLVK
ncbi:MAG: T9SS C-terminal target domain-containing protein [Methanobacteriota archaeon]|nr:MAG: T9SS C-terminal target domain-containing protein [Euryarchaeota archaeon]